MVMDSLPVFLDARRRDFKRGRVSGAGEGLINPLWPRARRFRPPGQARRRPGSRSYRAGASGAGVDSAPGRWAAIHACAARVTSALLRPAVSIAGPTATWITPG